MVDHRGTEKVHGEKGREAAKKDDPDYNQGNKEKSRISRQPQRNQD